MPRMLLTYDPAWADQFASIASEITTLSDADWLIEHIGSTAVPGMRAKPIIDLAIRVRDLQDFGACLPALEAGGWRRGSAVRTHPVMIRETDGVRTAIAHFFVAEDWDAANQRILRDWLLAHPDDVDRYSHAKCDAVAAEARGQSAYNAAKTPVIQEIVDRARAARGLPSVPVYGK
ncbi:GrpB family protein [Microbacterium sp. CGR1]|uniref:GrpB family protein n=1 Tax=Microbacterium sp. CGR1 TaxID=1696072 RepID=UPI003DA5EE9B